MSRNLSIRQARVRNTTIRNWKNNKTQIDEAEYTNGQIYMYNVSPATATNLTNGSWLQFAKALKKPDQVGQELEILLDLDQSPLTENGLLKIKWEEHTAEQLQSGDSWLRKATQSQRYAFSVLKELPINNRIKVFSFVKGDDNTGNEGNNTDTTIDYYVVEEVRYTRDRDGTITKTDIQLVNAIELLDDYGITADFKWTTAMNRPKNVKKVKVSFDKGVVFNSLILNASPNNGATNTNIDLIAQNRIASVNAPNWSLMPLYPANDQATIWKSEWPFETTYFAEMKSLASKTGYTGATISQRVAVEIDTPTQALGELQKWFAGTSANPNTCPNKLYSGKNNNGYSILSFGANTMGNEIIKIGRFEFGGALSAIEMYSNWYTSTFDLYGTFVINPATGFFAKGGASKFKQTSFTEKNGEVYRMGTTVIVEKRATQTDGVYLCAGGILHNKYYGTEEFKKDFITQQFDYLGTPFTQFPTKLEKIDKPKLGDYSLADRKYFCLVQNNRNYDHFNREVDNNTSETELFAITNADNINNHKDDDLSIKAEGKTNYARVFGFRYFATPYVDWTIPVANLNDQTATLQNTYFNVNYDNTYSIEVELDSPNWAFNYWGVRAWGQNGCKVRFEFIDSNDKVVDIWERELSSNLISTNSTTSKSYIIV